MTDICPACEQGVLAPSSNTEMLAYGGVELAVQGIQYSVCPVCGEEVVLEAQSKKNELRYADAKRVHDGLLTSKEIVAWRQNLGLSQQDAALLLGGGLNAFSKYERGEVIQSRSMDLLIRVSEQTSGVSAFLADRAGLDLPNTNWTELKQDDKPAKPLTLQKVEAGVAKKLGVQVAAYWIAPEHCADEANDGWYEAEEHEMEMYA